MKDQTFFTFPKRLIGYQFYLVQSRLMKSRFSLFWHPDKTWKMLSGLISDIRSKTWKVWKQTQNNALEFSKLLQLFFLHLLNCLFAFPSVKYFMIYLFNCPHWSSHLQLTFIFVILFKHPVWGFLDTQIQSNAPYHAFNQNLAAQSTKVWLAKHSNRGREKNGRGGGRHADQEKPSFYKHPTVVSLPTHNQTTQKPWDDTHSSSVRSHIFIPPQDIVIIVVKAKPRPVKHIPFFPIESYVNPCKSPSTVCAIQSYQCGLLIRKCKVGHL